MTRLEICKAVLRSSDEMANWYVGTLGLDPTAMTDDSVRTFGTGGHGDMASAMLNDALALGIITQEQWDDA